LALEKEGAIKNCPRSVVFSPADIKKEKGWIKRAEKQNEDRIKLFKYFGLE